MIDTIDIQPKQPVKEFSGLTASKIKTKGEVYEMLKRGIWLYVALLIFEGAIRKWILPSLATPLLVIRDPVAMWLLFTAWRYKEFPNSSYIWIIAGMTLFSIFTTITVGHHSIVVALYGARIFLFHFPLIFLIGRILNKNDVLQVAKVLLLISVPMFMLITLQFYSPQSAFVNKGIGADSLGGGFSGALGYYRPPGTFSFTTGNTQFFGLVAAFIIYFWLNTKEVNRILLIASTVCVIGAIPISISRGLLIQIVLSLTFALASISNNYKLLGRMVLAALSLVILLALLSKVGFIGTAIEVLTVRFSNASASEGGIDDTIANRIGAGIFEPFQKNDLPFFGLGLGMGTNAGAQLLTGRADEFLIAEGEWGRLIGEMGAIMGMTFIILRMSMCLTLLFSAFKQINLNNLLPWMLVSICFQSLAQGQWAQPTALGFGVVMSGFAIAAFTQEDNRQASNDQYA
jgi:hypothetical protein